MDYRKLCEDLILELRIERTWRKELQQDLRGHEKAARFKQMTLEDKLSRVWKDLQQGDYYRALRRRSDIESTNRLL